MSKLGIGFAVEITTHDIDQVDVSVTHNGWQWTTTWFNREELPVLVASLNEYMAQHPIEEGKT